MDVQVPKSVAFSWRSGGDFGAYAIDNVSDSQTLYSGSVDRQGRYAGTFDGPPSAAAAATDPAARSWGAAAKAAAAIDPDSLPAAPGPMPHPRTPLATAGTLLVALEEADGTVRRYEGPLRAAPAGIRDALAAARRLHNERYGMATAVPAASATGRNLDGTQTQFVMKPSRLGNVSFPTFDELRQAVTRERGHRVASAIVQSQAGFELLALGRVTGRPDPMNPGGNVRRARLHRSDLDLPFVRSSPEVVGLVDPKAKVFIDLRSAPVQPPQS